MVKNYEKNSKNFDMCQKRGHSVKDFRKLVVNYWEGDHWVWASLGKGSMDENELIKWSMWPRIPVTNLLHVPPSVIHIHFQRGVKSIRREDPGSISLWKFVAENHTENFATLKITLKNNIKESFTENYTEKRPLLFRNAKNGWLIRFLSKLNTISNLKPFINYIESVIITLKI